MRIRHFDSGGQGGFQAVSDGFVIGEMDYYWGDNNTMVINHTNVRPDYENQGVGKELVKAGVDYAREKGLKIYPQCAFAKAIFNRNSDYSDVRKT